MPFKPGQSGNPQKKFPKGRSGNPGGRPRKTPLTDALRRILRDDEKADALAAALIEAGTKGSYQAFKEIADRVEGKVIQRLEITGDDGGPVKVADVRSKRLDKLAPNP